MKAGITSIRLEERLRFSELIGQHLTDSRGENTQLPVGDLLRQMFYSRYHRKDARATCG